MKLVSFGPKGCEKPGVISGDSIIDLRAVDPDLPSSLRGILAEDKLPRVREILAAAAKIGTDKRVPIADVRLGPPITNPSKIICLGLNYIDHAREQGKDIPDWPLLFAKAPSCLAGDKDPIPIPTGVTQMDHEVELAFVIGRRAKNVPLDETMDYVAGYGVFMDISARDVQFREKQWFRGKSFDGFGPFGPYLTTADEITDPHDLRISLEVNGKTMQDSNTGRMRFKVSYLVHYLSCSMTLEPGDIVATGTPSGVGVFADPQRFLQRGNVLTATIQSLGKLTNTVA
jgi:2-keto-4-pentenoate hydratase/2-oxohepta-3-ene-1,7-dioic acid hydratase in catechol pathway